MDRKLKALFDYQKFMGNIKLERLIVETGNRYSRELRDDEMSIVSAAGEPFARKNENRYNDDGSFI